MAPELRAVASVSMVNASHMAVSRTLSPALIAEYQTQLPDKKLLQDKLREFYELNTTDRGENGSGVVENGGMNSLCGS